MRLYTHSNGKKYTYSEKTRLHCFILGLLFFWLEIPLCVLIGTLGCGINPVKIIKSTHLFSAILSKNKWNEYITHEKEAQIKNTPN